MARDWNECIALYVQTFADCIPVRGATRSAFYDLTRHEILLFPTDYYPLCNQIQGKTIGSILAEFKDDVNQAQVVAFLDFLDDNELIMLVDDPSLFPAIPTGWDYPGMIQNAIIDISQVRHNFGKIFGDLDALGCQHVQIRAFSNLLTLGDYDDILEKALDKSIAGVELILKYEGQTSVERYVEFMNRHPIITSVSVHSAKMTDRIVVNTTSPVFYEGAPRRELRFTEQDIVSERNCGVITQKQLTPPAVDTFFEAKSFNGCLNRKISIDSNGDIKKCPSMQKAYGNICELSLIDVARRAEFEEEGNLAKDQVEICKDCEFRYACSDCRAYLENPSNMYSKPLKCGYDPHKAEWSDWVSDPDKTVVARGYGMDSLLKRPKSSTLVWPTKI